MRNWKLAAMAAVVLAVLAGLGLANAPVVFAEAFPVLTKLGLSPMPPALISNHARPGPALGAVSADGHWRVQQIAPGTWALGEPQDDPDNYEYLLVGRERALLIDAGATGRDIRPVLATLTRLPVTVIPSHLHFDHTRGLDHFGSIALIDLPQTRERVRDGTVRMGRYQYLGLWGAGPTPVFRVNAWVKPDDWIELGGRRVQVLSTPGHTATSISVSDPAAKLLFTGDLIYPTSLYAFMTDSSLAAYVATADRLAARLPADTTIYGAHCCRNDAVAQAPRLGMEDLADAKRAAQAIQAGTAKGRGLILRRFPVNTQMTLITLYPFGNR